MFGMIKTLLGIHRWHYSNPYDRTCGVCGRHEVMQEWNTVEPMLPWWEVFDEGDPAPCNTEPDR